MAQAPATFTAAQPQLLLSKPGIQRDGTRLFGDSYQAGEWCRFYQDRPRKMLGYREMRRDVQGLSRALNVQSYDGYSYVHVGTQDVLTRMTIDLNTGLTSGFIDRTPVGFTADDANNWQFSLVYDTASNQNLLLAHAAPNILDIADTREFPVYYGEVRDPAAMVAISGSDVSGGVLALWPYFLRFGNDGEVAWPVPGDLLDLVGTGSGSARPWGTKIVRGLPLRGQSGPAGLLWALDAVIRVQFVGGTEIFRFDTLTTSNALMSSNGIIEHAGIYYWMTVSGYSFFNGVVRDIDNQSNRQFLLDGLNWAMRQKIFAFKIPRWNEIWWCAPMFGATECNWAFIYNYMNGQWYDTPLPEVQGGWTSAIYEQIFHYPLVTSAALNADAADGTSIWQHDFGLNNISGPAPIPQAIRSYIRTHEFNTAVPLAPGQLGKSQSLSFSLIEPDFGQRGDLNLQLLARANARASVRRSPWITIPATVTGNTQVAKTKFSGRLTSFLLVSNVVDGYYEFGSPTFHAQPSDERIEDGTTEVTEPEPSELVAPLEIMP
jgi:hypothetical protein